MMWWCGLSKEKKLRPLLSFYGKIQTCSNTHGFHIIMVVETIQQYLCLLRGHKHHLFVVNLCSMVLCFITMTAYCMLLVHVTNHILILFMLCQYVILLLIGLVEFRHDILQGLTLMTKICFSVVQLYPYILYVPPPPCCMAIDVVSWVLYLFF